MHEIDILRYIGSFKQILSVEHFEIRQSRNFHRTKGEVEIGNPHMRFARRETSGGRNVYERGLRPRFPPPSFHGWPRRRTTDDRACAAEQNVINTRTVLVFSGHTRVPH